MNQSEAALNQLISDNPKSPEVRDLYPYIISQSQLSKEDIYFLNGCPKIVLE